MIIQKDLFPGKKDETLGFSYSVSSTSFSFKFLGKHNFQRIKSLTQNFVN